MTDRHARLVQYLLDRGFGEAKRGYGHATAEEIADALIEDGWVETDDTGPE